MNVSCRWQPRFPAAVCLLLLLPASSSCHRGSGSDIGPKLADGPAFDFRVLFHDDTGTPAVAAKVSVSGVSATVTTGHSGR